MQFHKTSFEGLIVFEPDMFEDERGYFFESYNKGVFDQAGMDVVFMQDNQSKSSYGVIRGLHYQLEPYAQAKLLRVFDGKILDVVVDIREGSSTYGQAYSIELSSENKKQLYVPRGFAHGFSVLSETAVVFYKCDALYNKKHERGIIYNDPALSIDWKIPEGDAIISDKDKILPSLIAAEKNFKASA